MTISATATAIPATFRHNGDTSRLTIGGVSWQSRGLGVNNIENARLFAAVNIIERSGIVLEDVTRAPGWGRTAWRARLPATLVAELDLG